LPPVRVFDAERERALRDLREAAVQGRLSSDSSVRRLDDALRSRNRDDLVICSVICRGTLGWKTP
jgi:hypothetical protein